MEEYVTPIEAAKILHLSRSRLMHLKHKFPHIKSGDYKQGRVLFLKDKLIDTYRNLR